MHEIIGGLGRVFRAGTLKQSSLPQWWVPVKKKKKKKKCNLLKQAKLLLNMSGVAEGALAMLRLVV